MEHEAALSYSRNQSRLLNSGLITIDKVEYVDSDGIAVDAAELEYMAQRDKIAAMVGLRESEQIRVTDEIISPAVDLDQTHLEYLIRMALTNRGELLVIKKKEEIAQTSLSASKAKLIPWFDYVQAGVSREEEGGQRTGDNWGVQLAMSIPIFSWMNSESSIQEAALTSYYSQKGATQKIITSVADRVEKEWQPREEEGKVAYHRSRLNYTMDLTQGTWLILGRTNYLLDQIHAFLDLNFFPTLSSKAFRYFV